MRLVLTFLESAFASLEISTRLLPLSRLDAKDEFRVLFALVAAVVYVDVEEFDVVFEDCEEEGMVFVWRD